MLRQPAGAQAPYSIRTDAVQPLGLAAASLANTCSTPGRACCSGIATGLSLRSIIDASVGNIAIMLCRRTHASITTCVNLHGTYAKQLHMPSLKRPLPLAVLPALSACLALCPPSRLLHTTGSRTCGLECISVVAALFLHQCKACRACMCKCVGMCSHIVPQHGGVCSAPPHPNPWQHWCLDRPPVLKHAAAGSM